jgi:DNA-3-methyladenine glycosylase
MTLVVELEPTVLPPPARALLGAEFFARSSDAVARDLIGKVLMRSGFGGGRITEVEAYLPEGDPASHAARGRTVRNGAMFGPGGIIYVFLSYGVHQLLNLVCDREGVGSAVLIRSFEPLVGPCDPPPVGPGRAARALGIDAGLNGLPLGGASGLVVIDDGVRPEVAISTRIGISQGNLLPLRFFAAGSRFVSGNRQRMREDRT